MKKRVLILLLLLVCLAACRKAPEVTPSPTAEATPMPAQKARELWGFPIDDTHDAFEVDTKGKLGTVLVTVEQGEYESDGLYNCTFSVWAANDLTTPIQTFERMGLICWPYLMDANFDGHMDFCYTYYHGVANATFGLYIWDEEQGQFTCAGEAWGYGFEVDEEAKVLSNYVHYTMYSYAEEMYRWEDGELVCFRKVECESLNDSLQRTEYVTYELIDGEWQEVSRETYAMQGL